MKASTQVWVVKTGSSLLKDATPTLLQSWMRQVAELQKHHIHCVWVSSGSIVLGRKEIAHFPSGRIENQLLSAIGQPELTQLYLHALKKCKRTGAQVLLTWQDLNHPKQRQDLRKFFQLAFRSGVVPIVNENDLAARRSRGFRDNDALASELAVLLGAKKLIFLTSVDGVMDRMGHLRNHFQPGDTFTPLRLAGAITGRGGMASKVRAARFVARRGVQSWIVNGMEANLFSKILCGQSVGTRFSMKAA